MKTTITFLFILLLSFGASAQIKEPLTIKGSGDTASSYVNDEYNFSLTIPLNSKPDKGFRQMSGFISAYSCTNCSDESYFTFTKVLPLNASLADVVKTFQTKSVQENAAKALLKDSSQGNNAMIPSTKYVEYNGRPALRIDFNFTKNDISYSGVAVELFIKEKKIMTVFSFLSASPEPDAWFKACEDALRSVVVLKSSTIKPSREGIATRIGSIDNNAQNAPPDRLPPPPQPIKPSPPIPKKISGGVLNGKATSLPKPAYPAAARAVRAVGAVNVQVTIDHDGNVIEATAVSGHALLRAAAAAAARQAKFPPTLLSGQPVLVTGIIVYNFVEPVPVEK